MNRIPFLFSLLPVLVFGLPFLFMTDLFPFHRFGMFARIPDKNKPDAIVIRVKEGENWKELKSGSPNLDRGLLPSEAAACFSDKQKAEVFFSKIRASLRPAPDSMILEMNNSTQVWRKIGISGD
jgi:hypothetical protein